MRKVSTAERRIVNHLTVAKLAVQMLDRKTELTAEQQGLVRAASEAIDRLAADLASRREAEHSGARARQELAAGRQLLGAGNSNGRAAPRRGFAVGPAAVALVFGAILLLLVVVGAGLLLPILLVLLLVGAVAWLVRR